MDAKERDRRTREAMYDPKPGDEYHEMFSFWVIVVRVEEDGERILVMHGHPPCTLPDDGKYVEYKSHVAFLNAYAYGTIPGFCVSLSKRGVNVEGWANRYISDHHIDKVMKEHGKC